MTYLIVSNYEVLEHAEHNSLTVGFSNDIYILSKYNGVQGSTI